MYFADNTATFFNFYIDFSHLRAGYIESTVFQPAPSRVSTCTSTCFLLFVTDRKLKSSDKHFISDANPKSRNRGKPVWDCSDNDTDVYTPAWWTWFTRRPLRVYTILYDTRCYFNVRSKADISQLNLPHGNVKSVKTEKLKSKKTDMLRSNSKQSGKSI